MADSSDAGLATRRGVSDKNTTPTVTSATASTVFCHGLCITFRISEYLLPRFIGTMCSFTHLLEESNFNMVVTEPGFRN